MKISVIFTGGTIGSKVNEKGVIGTDASTHYRLIDMYNSKNPNTIEFSIKEPYDTLSENLNSVHIQKLAACIADTMENDKPDGIIVTHGSDTLQYTAAILSYLFSNERIPVILVASNYILDDYRSNGVVNFKYAIEFIYRLREGGVYVSYKNPGKKPMIHKGTRLLQPLPFSCDFDSVADSWYAKFSMHGYLENITKNLNYRTAYGNRDSIGINPKDFLLTPNTDYILRIVPYVGMTYPTLDKKTKVVLHESYHSGTICNSKELEEFAKQASALQIPIYLTGLSSHEREYESVEFYKKLGIIPLPETAVISQYCKLWLAISNGLPIESLMQISVAGDHLA